MSDPEKPEGGLRADPALVEGIVQTSPVGITVIDDDGRVTFANERAEEIYGRSRQEIDGFAHDDPRWDLVDEEGESLDKGEAPFDRVLASEEPVYDQIVGLLRPDGERVWVSVNGAPQWDHNGEFKRAVFAFEDITERIDRERELERKERRFEAIFEDPNILVGLLDPDGTVVDINQTAMEYVDADLDAVTGELFWETPWWDSEDEIQAQVREWTERAAGGEYVDFEANLTRPDGEEYTLSGYFRPVTDENGNVVSIIVSDRDITERKQRERDLEESERRYRTLVEHFPNGAVALVDEDIRYRTVGGNPTLIAGVTADEVQGQPVREVVPANLADELVPRYQAAFDGESGSFEAESNGRIFEVQVVPVRDDDGEVFAALGMSLDITERKRFEESIHELHETTRRLFHSASVEAVAREVVSAATEVLGLSDVALYLHDEDRDELYPAAKETEVGIMWDDLPRVAIDGETIIGNVYATGESVRWDDIRESPHFIGAETDMRAGVYAPVGDHGAIFAGSDTIGAFEDQTLQLLELLAANAEAAFDRVERARQLEESERRYRTLVENFPNGAVALFDEDLRYQATGGQAFEEIGASTDEVVGQTVWERYPEDLAAHLEPKFRAALAGEANSFELEFHDRHWSAYTVPVRDDADEVFAGMLMVQDITERKEREQELQENKNQLRALIDVLPVAVFVAEADGEIVEWNEAAEEIWGGEVVESESVAEYAEYEAWWADTGEPVDPEEWPLARALEGEEVTDPDEIEIKRFDGERRMVLNHGMPVRDADGNVTRAVVTLVDITERKEYQQKLEESNERLEQFAYAVSHDLQEPLRMVSSYVQLLENRYGDELDSDAQEFIDFAADGADRMREMIQGLLQYSRVDSRGDPFEPVDLDAVLADVRQDLGMKITESDAEITVEDLPTVYGDGGQLNQVFQNLLSNAIEYSGDEPPRIHVSAERQGEKWTISVADEGIGIDPDDTDRVFEVFQSLHGPERSGTGIGLALCERIVERHGGDIWVDSEPGEGATFSFTVPAADASAVDASPVDPV